MRLHEQRDDLENRLEEIRQATSWLRDHLLSSKFAGPDPFDKYINRDDILRWMDQNINPHL